MLYRRKPTIVEAIQYNGTNEAECKKFCPFADFTLHLGRRVIKTSEQHGEVGDYLVQYSNEPNHFKIISKEEFEKTYECFR